MLIQYLQDKTVIQRYCRISQRIFKLLEDNEKALSVSRPEFRGVSKLWRDEERSFLERVSKKIEECLQTGFDLFGLSQVPLVTFVSSWLDNESTTEDPTMRIYSDDLIPLDEAGPYGDITEVVDELKNVQIVEEFLCKLHIDYPEIGHWEIIRHWDARSEPNDHEFTWFYGHTSPDWRPQGYEESWFRIYKENDPRWEPVGTLRICEESGRSVFTLLGRLCVTQCWCLPGTRPELDYKRVLPWPFPFVNEENYDGRLGKELEEEGSEDSLCQMVKGSIAVYSLTEPH